MVRLPGANGAAGNVVIGPGEVMRAVAEMLVASTEFAPSGTAKATDARAAVIAAMRFMATPVCSREGRRRLDVVPLVEHEPG